MFYFDPTYIFAIIGFIITMIASSNINKTYTKYSQVAASSGLTGAQVAQKVLQANGIYGVTVNPIEGSLTDHYDPKTKIVNLSRGVYSGKSLAALGVAAHECGHAVQDDVDYFPLRLRHALVPVANFGSRFGWIMILAGLIFGGLIESLTSVSSVVIVNVGIALFSLAVLFQLVTLPVEFNASRRAMKNLEDLGILTGDDEIKGAENVLKAAALTYVASASASILQLLRIFIISRGRGNSRR